jgi:hypothetical protein
MSAASQSRWNKLAAPHKSHQSSYPVSLSDSTGADVLTFFGDFREIDPSKLREDNQQISNALTDIHRVTMEWTCPLADGDTSEVTVGLGSRSRLVDSLPCLLVSRISAAALRYIVNNTHLIRRREILTQNLLSPIVR